MPKTFILTLTIICLLISSCAPATPQPNVTPGLVSTSTQTPQPVPAGTATASPSSTFQPPHTPAPPTITPLPTIPTFTPTFDIRTVATVTPGQGVKCLSNSQLKFFLPTEDPQRYYPDYKDAILNFINAGGDISEIYNTAQSDIYTRGSVYLQDVTNDGTPELIWVMKDGAGGGGEIYGCNPDNSKYELLYQPRSFNPDDYYRLVGIKDMNGDGIVEVVMIISSHGSAIFIIEWKGDHFENLILENTGLDNIDWAGALYLTDVQLIDLDQNGTIELVWKGGVGLPWSQYDRLKSPRREEIYIYAWDGEHFVPQPMRYAAPVYRFQAVQDADQETLRGEYEQAFAAYQDAIFSNTLDSWSEKRSEQVVDRLDFMYGTATPTSFPEDKTEYPRLAAYAYYRMIILHTHLGEMDAAQIQYKTLQTKFPIGNPGHPYVEMATDFWNAYKKSSNIYIGCAAAIQYAAEHPEILIPLNWDYIGRRSDEYAPADVCPFR